MLLLLFPIRTDAPLYHYPYATLGLIATNVVVFILTWLLPLYFGVGDQDAYYELMCVTLGGGAIQPWTWLTATFCHFTPDHLIFNMLFLWTFGLIIEGKTGSLRFLAICAGVGIVGNAVVQASLMGIDYPSWSCGASVIVRGLMVIALLWSPRNEIGVAYFFWVLFFIRFGVWNIAVSSFFCLVIAYQWISAFAGGTFLTSEFLHLAGMLLGGLVGYVMLVRKHVDCEGWDLLSVMQGKSGRQLKRAVYEEIDPSLGPSSRAKARLKKKKRKAVEERRRNDEETNEPNASARDRAIARIHTLVKQRKARAALQLLNEQQQLDETFEIPGRDLLLLAQQLHELGRSDDAVRFLCEYLDRFPEKSDKVRLTTAAIMINEQSRPTAALRTLSPISDASLTDGERKRHLSLLKQANAMIADGVIEFGEGAW